MDLHVSHETRIRLADPVRYSIQALRLTPADTAFQTVLSWSVHAGDAGTLTPGEDHFGNRTHIAVHRGSHDEIVLRASGRVRTRDTHGIATGMPELFPLRFYLRKSPLTAVDERLEAFARKATSGEVDALGRLHRLMPAVRESMDCLPDDPEMPENAADALAGGRGTGTDQAHVFIACARSLGIPARFVGGHIWTGDEPDERSTGHGWAEAFVDGLGWVGFDVVNCCCPTDAYVRFAHGLDSLDAAPVRAIPDGPAVRKTELTRYRVQAMEQAQA